MANEKRLIDANEYCRELYQERDYPGRTREFMDAIEVAIADLCDMPTVNAVEVVHGHWISLTDCANAGVYCSVCNKKVWKEDYAWCNRKNKLRSNYCPNCGADMRGADNG